MVRTADATKRGVPSPPGYRSVLAHKPVAIMGASISMTGTARAQGQLKQVLLGTLSEIFSHPEVLVASASSRFDSEGHLVDEPTQNVLSAFLEAYAKWLGRFAP